MKPTIFNRHGNISLYIPNLIGYARILFALTAFAIAHVNPATCIILYLVSFACDELDGRAARAFNQTSTFGAVLDMLTDRLSTTGLLLILSLRFPKWYFAFLLLISLDIFSHWLQMYSSLVAGDISHKYYVHRLFMGFCCVSCEVLYLALYLLGWPDYWKSPALSCSLPWTISKASGCTSQVRWPVALIIVMGSLPGFLVKQVVNVAQIKAAASALIILDQEKGRTKLSALKQS